VCGPSYVFYGGIRSGTMLILGPELSWMVCMDFDVHGGIGM
jgi:hypothetical protein